MSHRDEREALGQAPRALSGLSTSMPRQPDLAQETNHAERKGLCETVGKRWGNANRAEGEKGPWFGDVAKMHRVKHFAARAGYFYLARDFDEKVVRATMARAIEAAHQTRYRDCVDGASSCFILPAARDLYLGWPHTRQARFATL